LLRIPGWAGPATRVRVNGKAMAADIRAGQFLPLDMTWKNGDRVDISFDMALRLESIHPAHPEVVSLLLGPLVLLPLLPAPDTLRRDELLQATRTSSSTWKVSTRSQIVELKPFMFIGDEPYRLYSRLAADSVA
jgi:DUF1680 family protein